MKLKKTIKLNGQIIKAGTVLEFGNEGYTTFKGQRIHKTQIPEAAVESVSQRRNKPQGSVLAKSIRLGKLVIPAGESLQFNEQGMAKYKGQDISIYQIPSRAFEAAIAMEAQLAVSSGKLKMPVCVEGTIIPAGESLQFNADGMADYNGQQISIYSIPSAAFESVNNAVDTEKQYKAFDDIEPGDIGTDQDGQTIRFLGKATGKAGYDALVGQFGNASGKTFEDITAGMDDEAIEATKFVCYTIPDGTVCIGIYDKDYVTATESDGEHVAFVDVQSGDDAIDVAGKKCTIVAKGQGTVWYDKMLETLKLECQMANIKKRLGIEDDDELKKQLQNAEFVVVIDDKNNKSIDLYGADGVKVIKAED